MLNAGHWIVMIFDAIFMTINLIVLITGRLESREDRYFVLYLLILTAFNIAAIAAR